MAYTAVSITSPIAGVSRTVHVDPSAGLSIDLPSTLIQKDGRGNNYVRVQSTFDISVAALTFVPGRTADGYLAIPGNSFGDLYLFYDYKNSVLSLTTLYDETHVTVVSSVDLIYGNGTGVRSLSLTLSSLNSYQIKCYGLCRGYVNASSPVSVIYGSFEFSGSESPYRTSFLEQAVQITDRPLTFIVPMLSNISPQAVMCVSTNNTHIQSDHRDGSFFGSYTYIARFKSAKYITTNQSASCTYRGHGFTTIIPPTRSYTNFYRFLTPSLPNFTHHAAIMILSSEKGGIRLDNSSPNAREETVSVNSQSYSVLYVNVTSAGQHDITHMKPSINFGVIMYGFKVNGNGSYAYPAGMKIK